VVSIKKRFRTVEERYDQEVSWWRKKLKARAQQRKAAEKPECTREVGEGAIVCWSKKSAARHNTEEEVSR